MSAPPARNRPTTPLHERSNSQSNRLGIRLVPYSPPRLDPENRAPSEASARDSAGSRGGSEPCSSDQASSDAGHARRTSWRDEVTGHPSSDGQGSASSSATAPRFSLARSRDERVSGAKRVASPSGAGSARPTALHSRSTSEVSARIAALNAASGSQRSHVDDSLPQPPRTRSRRHTLQLSVNPDNKTFSLVRDVPQPDVSSSVTGSTRSPPLSYSYSSRTPSAQDRLSIDAWSDQRSSTPLTGASTTIPDQSSDLLPSATASAASSSTQLADEPSTSSSSPWNYRMVGGLRKVPKTPDAKGKQPLYNTAVPAAETSLDPLPEISAARDEAEETPTRTVLPKPSFATVASSQTIETVSEATNYKVYAPVPAPQESRDTLVSTSASKANWEVVGRSSPVSALQSTPSTHLHGGNESENYVLHGASSVSSSSLGTIRRHPRPAYSQESLVVAPLRPKKKRSSEPIGSFKQRSHETLRSRTGSVQSLRSISSVITSQDPSQAVLSLASSSASTSLGGDSKDIWQNFPWSTPQPPTSSSSNPQTAATRPPTAQMLQPQPHQWSSQLSTVMSESEGGSDSVPARSVSPLSEGTGHRRGSSAGWVSSMHSRQMASISSSIAGQLDEAAPAPENDSLDQPHPSYPRPVHSPIRLVHDQDEHGDGLAELDQRPSRSGLHALFMNGANRALHSNASSRANSFTSSIPAWARVYYGSGERRWLGRQPSFMTVSESGDSRPGSSAFNGSESPNPDQFPETIYNPRKRPREVQPAEGQHLHPDQAAMEITPAPPPQQSSVFRSLKEKTSSIWSPHLHTDRRASRYSVWDPPSVSWSADSGILGRRNIQVVLFILGFILPLAWMIAAFLPLPPNPKLQTAEAGHSPNRLGAVQPASRYQRYLVEEARYESARWWRNLNRIMSVVGLLITGAVIALAVVGVRQGWGARR